jgi:2-dehydropantoate 2-reductase
MKEHNVAQRKSVVILGAGAMGAMYASLFYKMDPTCIAFAATGERYVRLKQEGIVVNGKHYPIPALSPDDPAPPADLVLVAVKHHHLIEALPALENRVEDNTLILSVMNGLDSETIIGSVYGQEKVLYAIAAGTDPRREGKRVQYDNSGTIFFGEVENHGELSERVKSVQALFEKAGIGYQTPPDMMRILWWKFMVNVGMNQTSAVLSIPYGVFQRSEHARQIMESAMREAKALSEAANVNLSEQDIEDWYAVMQTMHPEGKTSMLQDVEAGRKTEVEIFAGKVIELGETYHIPTPVNETLFHAIKVIEERSGIST